MSIKETEKSFILTQAGHYFVGKGKPERRLTADQEKALELKSIEPCNCPIELGKNLLSIWTKDGKQDLILEITPNKPIAVVRQLDPEGSGTILEM